MGSYLDKLLEISSASMSLNKPSLDILLPPRTNKLLKQLDDILNIKNGFQAFECSLRFFSADPCFLGRELNSWNDSKLWIDKFDGMADDAVFFAEDVFGGQFCIQGEEIKIFDPETGEMEFLANDFESWAKEILEDYEVLTGYNLARKWQKANGVIEDTTVLTPITPFILGGEFELDNLYKMDVIKVMLYRAGIARQIRDLPDGAEIQLDIIN